MSDNTDALPYKARFLADEDVDKPLMRMVDTLIAFMHAHEAGLRQNVLFSSARQLLRRAAPKNTLPAALTPRLLATI